MKKTLLVLWTIIAVFCSCDDNTDSLGYQMMPSNDMIHTFDTTFFATTRTVAAGNVLARTSISYLGQFTDPESYTSIKADFLSQFHCTEDFAFADSVVNNKIRSTYLYLYISDFVGDSLQSMKLSVYPLTRILDPEQNYYTNIDPEQYYDASSAPIAEKWFTVSDRTMTDSARYATEGLECIKIPLPSTIGQTIYDDYRVHPEHFENTTSFLNSGLPCSKGFYFKLEAGDGVMVSIDISQFTLSYDMFDSEDSTTTAVSNVFAATEEIVQATRFDNLNLESLINDSEATYIKSPAGLFTELTLPIESFAQSRYYLSDTTSINSVNLTLTRYNDVVESGFKLNIPSTILLVRADDYYNGYFEKYNLADGETSFLATFNKTSNTYEFSNITPLINKILSEHKSGRISQNYNKVLLIPVETTYDTSKNLVKLCHDFSMTSAKLVGGAKDKVKMEVVYSSYR